MTGDEATIEQLVANVERGAKWLAEHDSDPPGRFYLWWKARLIPSTPMPAQPEEVRAAYGVWFRAYEGTDYEYRFTAPKEEVVLAVADEVRAIDYSGFKRTSERRRGHWYGDALMEVWVTMMRAYWARRNGR